MSAALKARPFKLFLALFLTVAPHKLLNKENPH